ncbi:MAG: hypothetical protein ND895_09245 [Pyrinomonadaceae bacterium]|nr:hypothetical protein [Pyrinomonadaceae bacterium]
MTSQVRLILIVGSLIVVGTAVVLFAIGRQKAAPKDSASRSSAAVHRDDLPERPSPSSRNYVDIRREIEAERVSLAARYRQATSDIEKARLVGLAREVITRSIYTEVFPSWYGTAWDFNGTTETPRQGKIACGYFVSTVLRDAGWRVQRVKLAQQASENIILSLTTDAYIKRFRRVEIGKFVNAVKDWGPGLYVVGLDIHVGFIVNTADQVYFIHSSYIDPYAVVKESAMESKILAASHYRVIGKVSADDVFIVKWLLGTDVATRSA